MPTFKVFIAGLPGSGKTEFIKTVSDLPLVSIDKKIVTTETMVAMDYGRTNMNRNMIYLYAPAQDTNLALLWDDLSFEMHGSILLIDSTNHQLFTDASTLNDILSRSTQTVHLLVATKTDLPGAASMIEIQNTMNLGDDSIIIPCVATRRASAIQVILSMLDLLNKA